MKTNSLRLAAVGLAVLAISGSTSAAAARDFTAATLVAVSGPSPFADCTSDAVALQMGTNFPDSAVEPSLTSNPLDPANIVGSWQQDRWSNGGARGLAAAVTYDGGSSWAIKPIPGITRCTGGIFLRASDPWLSFGPTGDLYQVSLVFHTGNTADGLAHRAILVSKATDGGTTWSDPTAVADNTDAGTIDDKETITADPTDANLVYVIWDRIRTGSAEDFVGERASGMQFDNLAPPRAALGPGSAAPVYFARSTNAGQTWQAARSIYDPGAGTQTVGNQIVVEPDGTLLDSFTLIRTRSDGSTEYAASLLRSTDKGVTWASWGDDVPMRPRVLFSGTGAGVYDPESGHALRTGDILAQVAVNPTDGNLYRVWEDARFSNHDQFADPSQIIDEIAFSMSTNGGVTWSTPIKVNQTPTDLSLGDRQAFTPSIGTAADGTVAVTYYDFRLNDTGADLKTDYFAVHCHPSAVVSCADSGSWTSEVRLTTASFDMRRAPDAAGFFVGDYEGLTTDGSDFLALFSQTLPADSARIFSRRFGPAATPTATTSRPAAPTSTATPALTIPGATKTASAAARPTDTPPPSRTPTSTATQIATLPQSCVGDCNNNGSVTVDELLKGVGIALQNLPVSACPSFENAQGKVDIARLIEAVNAALNGCAG
jgi:hypothetical protein